MTTTHSSSDLMEIEEAKGENSNWGEKTDANDDSWYLYLSHLFIVVFIRLTIVVLPLKAFFSIWNLGRIRLVVLLPLP